MASRGSTKKRPVKYYSPKRRAIYSRGEDINSLEVFEEDDWMCQLCYVRIDPRVRYPAWSCATLDHIIPLSHGGQHVRENIQTAHRYCNERKGNSIDFTPQT